MVCLQVINDFPGQGLYLQWQVQVQQKNFEEYGLDKEMVVLVALERGKQPSEYMKQVEKDFTGKIYYYEDTRETKHYMPSIRPHLIKKYLKDHPTDVFFYGDQDIIFLQDPQLDRFKEDQFHYVASKAQGYTYSKYLKGFPVDTPEKQRPKSFFMDLCFVLGMDRDLYEANDEHCGGAQYIIRGTDYKFWDKVERDCEKGYKWAFDVTRDDARKKIYHYQIWGIDLVVLFYNLLKTGTPVRHLHEIDFTWPYDTFDNAAKENFYIMHNAGIDGSNDHETYYNLLADGKEIAKDIKKTDFKPVQGVNYEWKEHTKRRRYMNKDNYRSETPFHADHSYIDKNLLQSKYVSYFNQLRTKSTEKKMKILALWNSTYGRKEKPIHPALIDKSLQCLKKAVEYTTECEIEVVTTAWEEIPFNPFKQYVTPFNGLGHLNYILQLKQQVLNHTGDIVAIIEHDCLIPENYFNEIIKNWNFGKYGLNNRNYIGINTTGYLDVKERHHPYSAMSFAKFYFEGLLSTKLDECIKRIGDWGGAAKYGWCCVEPDNKGEMHDFWASKPMIHVSGQKLGEYQHNFTTHDIVCYEQESKGKVERADWGHYLELLPFMKNYAQ